jgi:hypothetical protein
MSESSREKNTQPKADEPQLPFKDRPYVKLTARLTLPEQSRTRSRRRKSPAATRKVREPSEAKLREQAAWKLVEETGKPVLFEDQILIPDDMNPWEAIELLPDGIREQTRSALQKHVGKAYIGLVKKQRAEILEKIEEEGKWEQYRTFPYAAQMAVADSLVRRRLGFPEESVKEPVKIHGGKVESTSGDDTAK